MLCCADFQSWENCLWRHCRSWGAGGQQATPSVTGSDFAHEIFHLILRQTSLYFLNRKVGLTSSQEPSFYLQHIANPLVSHVCTGYPVQQTASLFLSQIFALQLTQQISFNISHTPVFFLQPVAWLHVQKMSSRVISFVPKRQSYTVSDARDPRGTWCTGMPRHFWYLPTYWPIMKLFWPEHRGCSHFAQRCCSLSGRRRISHVGGERAGCSFH